MRDCFCGLRTSTVDVFFDFSPLREGARSKFLENFKPQAHSRCKKQLKSIENITFSGEFGFHFGDKSSTEEVRNLVG